MLYNMFFREMVLYLQCKKSKKQTVFHNGWRTKRLNYDERTNDSRDASVSDSEVSCHGQRAHVPGVDSPVAKKIGNGGCLTFRK